MKMEKCGLKTHIILAGCLGARRLFGLLARVLLAFALTLEIVPLVFGLVATLSYIIHQRSDDVALLHCTEQHQNTYKYIFRMT